MVNNYYDVVIVGAGPSGCSCAYNLKRNNPKLRVLLIDKAEFPRYKPCGGGISPEVSNYFDFDLSEAVDYHCKNIVMVANGKVLETTNHELWLVRREIFDQFLLAKARDIGVECLTACEVLNIKQHLNNAEVITNLGNYFAKIVALGEGSRGKLAKKLGILPKTNILAAIEYEHYTANLDGKLYIDFDYNDSGYAWNFPKSDGLSLGIGGFLKGQEKGNVSLPKRLQEYVRQFSIDNVNKKYVHGHPIALYSGRQKLVHGRIVLIGEIAGCVDPLTAEGIRPAIKSGFLAAKEISQTLSANKLQLLQNYERQFHRQIGKDMQYARVMSYFLNRHLCKILPMLSSERSINTFMKVFSGKTTYKEQLSFRRIMRMIAKVLF